MNFYSPIRMKKYIKRIKKVNPNSKGTLMGMDIGRIYVGTAVSDRYLTKTLPLHTFILRSGTEMNVYPQFKEEYDLNMDFFIALNRLIEQYSVKGLIIGYPVSFNKEKSNDKHCEFIESFVKHMCRNEVLKIPLTYVNEEFTTFQAGKLIELSQIKDGKLDNTLNLRKKLKDKVAASIILQKFLNYLDEDEDTENDNV